MKTVLRLLKGLVRLVLALVSAVVNAVYKTITRTALYLATAYLVVYFSLNADAGRELLMEYISAMIPGRTNCSTLQWGPWPADITIIDADIRDELNTPIIRVQVADTTLDLERTWGWILRMAVGRADRFELFLTKGHTFGADVIVSLDEDGWTGIEAGFDDVSKPYRNPGRAALIDITDAVVKNGRFRLIEKRSGVTVDARGLDVIDAHVLVDDTRTWVKAPQFLSTEGELSVDGLGPGGTRLVVPWRNLNARSPQWLHGELILPAANGVFSRTPADISGYLDIRPERAQVDGRAHLEIPEDEPLLTAYLGDRISGSGQIDVVAEGDLGWPYLMARIAATSLVVDGFEAGPIDLGLDLRNGPHEPVAALRPLSLELGDSVVHLDAARYYPEGLGWPDAHGRRRARIEAELRLDHFLPSRLWELGWLDGALPAPLNGRLDGPMTASAALLARADGGTDWRVGTTLALDGTWTGPSPDEEASNLPLAPLWRVAGAVEARIDDDPGGSVIAVDTSLLQLESGPDTVTLSGLVRSPGLAMDLATDLSVDLGHLLGSLGVPDIDGRVRGDDLWVTGRVMSPDVRGDLLVTGGRVRSLDVPRLSTIVTLVDGVLDLRRLSATTQYGRLRTDARLELWTDELTQLSETMPLTLRRLEASKLELADLEIPKLAGTATVRSNRFDLQLRAPDLAPQGSADIVVEGLRAWGESFSRFSTAVAADGSRISAKKLDLRTPAGASLTASGWYDLRAERLKVDATLTNLDFESVAALQRARLPLDGRIDKATVAISGRVSAPDYSGDVTVSKLRWDGLSFGGATLGFETRPKARAIALTSQSFFPSVRLRRGRLRLDDRGLPTRLEAGLELNELNLLRLVPALRGGLDAATVAAGQVDLSIDFDGRRPLRLVAEVPDNALRLDIGAHDPIVNVGPLQGSLVGDVVAIERLVAQWGGQRFATCGELKLGGTMALDVAGAIDLSRIPNIHRYVADVTGQVVTSSVQNTIAPFEDSCLLLAAADGTRPLAGATGYVEVGNTMSAPELTGALRFDQVQGRPRGLGREVSIESGLVVLKPSAGRAGSQQIEIPVSRPLSGSLDEGTFRISGKAKLPELPARTRLSHWMPNKGMVRIEGEDLYWAVPKEYRVTLDPQLELRFSDLWQPDERERARLPRSVRAAIRDPSLKLSGAVNVPEGAYFRNFTFLARSFGSVLGERTVAAYSKDLDDILPMLKDTRFDVRVRGNNFLVRSDFGVGRTDLDTRFDLDLRGTFENPRLVGNLGVTDGTITYNVFRRVFDVVQASLDFDGDPEHPKLLVRAETTIEAKKPGLAREGDQYEEYTVTVEVTGRVPDYKIALSSKPSLPEIDVQYLVLVGKTKQQLNDEGLGSSSLDVVAPDLTALVSDVIEAPFVDNLVVSPTLTGGGRVEAIFRLGQRIRIGVVGRQEGSVTTYDARYRQKILDNLVLEAIRRGPGESNRDRERYEVQLKYTVPVD